MSLSINRPFFFFFVDGVILTREQYDRLEYGMSGDDTIILWDDGIVPYYYDEVWDDIWRPAVQYGMQMIQNSTCIR